MTPQERNEIIEECAKVAEAHAFKCIVSDDSPHQMPEMLIGLHNEGIRAREIATEIRRALKQQEAK